MLQDLSTIDKSMIESVYKSVEKGLKSKSVGVVNPDVGRSEEDYSYKTLDNFKVDLIEKYIENKMQEHKNVKKLDISEMRKLTVNEGFELFDQLFPVIRLGISYEGFRRSRKAGADAKGLMKNELLEIDTTSTIPGIIYFLQNTMFDKDEYYKQFEQWEIEDMEELFICLMGRTLNQSESNRLKSYLLRDKVTEIFYWTLDKMIPKAPTEFKHPNPINIDIFDGITVVVENINDIIYCYIKSVLLPYTVYLISSINTYNEAGNRYRMIIRSISGYRLVLERDIGCTFDVALSAKTSIALNPKITVLKTNEQ